MKFYQGSIENRLAAVGREYEVNKVEMVGILKQENCKLLKELHASWPADRHKISAFQKKRVGDLIVEMFDFQKYIQPELSNKTGSVRSDGDILMGKRKKKKSPKKKVKPSSQSVSKDGENTSLPGPGKPEEAEDTDEGGTSNKVVNVVALDELRQEERVVNKSASSDLRGFIKGSAADVKGPRFLQTGKKPRSQKNKGGSAKSFLNPEQIDELFMVFKERLAAEEKSDLTSPVARKNQISDSSDDEEWPLSERRKQKSQRGDKRRGRKRNRRQMSSSDSEDFDSDSDSENEGGVSKVEKRPSASQKEFHRKVVKKFQARKRQGLMPVVPVPEQWKSNFQHQWLLKAFDNGGSIKNYVAVATIAGR